MAEPLFSVRGLKVALPDMTRKPLLRPGAEGRDPEGPRLRPAAQFGHRHRRRIRLRQVDARPRAGAAHRADARAASSSTGATSRICRRRALKPLRRDLQMIFQDPMSSLNPRRTIAAIIAAPLKQNGMGDNLRRPRRRGAAARRPARKLRQALPPRAVRRPAPARRHRPRAGAVAEIRAGRRDRLGPRRLDPGADPDAARKARRRDGADRRLHQPRPLRGPAPVQAGDRHAQRRDRRGRPDRRAVRRAAARLHARADRGDPAAGDRPGLAGRKAEPARRHEAVARPCEARTDFGACREAGARQWRKSTTTRDEEED